MLEPRRLSQTESKDGSPLLQRQLAGGAGLEKRLDAAQRRLHLVRHGGQELGHTPPVVALLLDQPVEHRAEDGDQEEQEPALADHHQPPALEVPGHPGERLARRPDAYLGEGGRGSDRQIAGGTSCHHLERRSAERTERGRPLTVSYLERRQLGGVVQLVELCVAFERDRAPEPDAPPHGEGRQVQQGGSEQHVVEATVAHDMSRRGLRPRGRSCTSSDPACPSAARGRSCTSCGRRP